MTRAELRLQITTIVTYAASISVFFVLMELFTTLYSGIPEHREHLEYLYVGLDGQHGLVPWMWVSSVLMIAALIMLYSAHVPSGNQLLAASCICIFISLWIEKGMGLIVGGLITVRRWNCNEISAHDAGMGYCDRHLVNWHVDGHRVLQDYGSRPFVIFAELGSKNPAASGLCCGKVFQQVNATT